MPFGFQQVVELERDAADGGAKFMRGVGRKIALGREGFIYSDQHMVEGTSEQGYFIVSGSFDGDLGVQLVG